MGIVAKYKFNQNTYANFIPEFNSTFTDYTITDEVDTDGFTIRTIESDDLPTLMRFGQVWADGESGATDKSKSLLEIYECNTSNTTSMNNMFRYCSKLTLLDLSNFNTSQVTDMQGVFANCSSLISLDVSNFNTNNVTNMYAMFYNCSSLTSLDLSNFNTSQVTNMQQMFQDCSSLTSLNVSNFNTEKVTYMISMFNNCSSLTSLDLSNFNTGEVTNMASMFNNCSSLTSLNLSNFDTNQVTSMNQMFYSCSSLTSLDVSNFNIKNVVADTDWMFRDCFKLIDIGAIYCNSLTINKISDVITTNTSIYYMDAKLEDLTKKSNITYKEYKMNILESDEEIELHRIGDVYDELNLATGELVQKIEKFIFDGSEVWYIVSSLEKDNTIFAQCFKYTRENTNAISNVLNYDLGLDTHDEKGFRFNNSFQIRLNKNELSNITNDAVKEWVSKNNIIVFKVKEQTIKTINLEGKPSINWQGDTYLHLENNTLYPQLDCEIESINYYEILKLKANTLYTLRYVGEPTECIFGGLTYKTENNMILTSGSSDNLLYFDKEIRKVVLIEGDVRDRNFDYFEGIESLGAVEIITHKSDMSIFSKIQLPPHIQLHRLPDGTYDELDIKTGILTRNVGYIELDGSENWLTASSGDGWYKHYIKNELFGVDLAISDKYAYFQGVNEINSTLIINKISLHYSTPKYLYIGTDLNLKDFKLWLNKNNLKVYYKFNTPITEKLILNYNNSCNYGVILPRGTSDNYNVITNEYKQNLDFIPIDGSIAFDTATLKDTTVKFSVALSKFEVDTTNVRGSDGIYCDNNLFKYETSDNDYEHAYIENDTTLHIYVNKNRLSSYDQVGFQLYLTSNSFNIYYAMRTPIISYVNYEDLNPEKASWEMLDCTEDGSITIESGNMDKTLLLDCMDYIAPTKNRFEIDLLKPNTQYTIYAEGVSGKVQLNFGGNIVNFTSGNIYTSGETQLVEFYTDNEIKNLIIIEGDTRTETIDFFEGLKSSENITVISSNTPFVFGKGGKIQ